MLLGEDLISSAAVLEPGTAAELILKIVEDLFILLGFVWLSVFGSDFLALTKSKNNDVGNNKLPY